MPSMQRRNKKSIQKHMYECVSIVLRTLGTFLFMSLKSTISMDLVRASVCEWDRSSSIDLH